MKTGIALERKTIFVPFELKSLSEDGEFTGVASPYKVRDLKNDVVDAGAFTKTIAERGNKVRLLDGHEVRIGIATVTDSAAALEAKGKINLDKQAGRDAYSDLKFYRDNGLPMGLSIGFETIKAEVGSDGARHLREVRLWEISITEFPANESAQVTDVKHAKESPVMERKTTFAEALAAVQAWAARYQYLDALSTAICATMRDEKFTTEECNAQIAESCDQFKASMLELCPKLRMLMNEEYGYDFKALFEVEKKTGRKISADSRTKIEAAITQLQALMEEEAADGTSETKKIPALETKSTPASGAAAPVVVPEPVDHSALMSKIDETKGAFQWNLSNKN